jgi:hypothetical protein
MRGDVMEVVDAVRYSEADEAVADPRDVETAMAAVSSSTAVPEEERRTTARAEYRVDAHLRLLPEVDSEGERVIYTRDIDEWGIGFVTAFAFAPGRKAIVRLQAPSGKELLRRCTVLRCREILPGWFESAVALDDFEALLSCEEVNVYRRD